MNQTKTNKAQAGSSRRHRAWILLLVIPAAAAAALWFRAEPDADTSAVSTFLDGYFSSWSARSMTAYERCFMPEATICYIDQTGAPHSNALQPFIASQKEAHLRSTQPMTEIPLKKKISINGRLAQAEVRWRLSKGSETVTGVDFFCLTRTGDGWRIISLVFAEDDRS